MTVENTAQTWRDLADQLIPAQMAMLARDEQNTDLFDAASLLFPHGIASTTTSLTRCTDPITTTDWPFSPSDHAHVIPSSYAPI
ncbi:hypothetical protein [Mycobacterium terramassiliense]|uniref:Mycobacterium terramassiliense ORFan n=1 Tax=Mycobacterium terramassiliense TaxID=1841859 RepID=A0A2U3NIJ8_9MYCO|nr:hypothetical protein [Mycobacterium terramassiliense]SPM31348.1 Mycobacterium terramassiliense ORFan [Mycobacterium terramassiliense]